MWEQAMVFKWGASCSLIASRLLFKGVFSRMFTKVNLWLKIFWNSAACLSPWVWWSHPQLKNMGIWTQIKGTSPKNLCQGVFCFGIKQENLPDVYFLTIGAMDTNGFDWMPGRNGDGCFAPLPAGGSWLVMDRNWSITFFPFLLKVSHVCIDIRYLDDIFDKMDSYKNEMTCRIRTCVSLQVHHARGI